MNKGDTMNSKKDIPLVLAMDEAENKLLKTVNEVINDYNLPCFLIKPIIDKISIQITNGAKNELVTAKNEFAYKNALEEGKK